MKYFVACPNCGYELLKAENGSYIEITCPSCNKDLVVEVNDNSVIINNSLEKNDL